MQARVWARALAVMFVLGTVQSGWADVATAEKLFQEGRRLMAYGSIEEACAKFTESQRLDPSSGTLINLAACHAELGMTASAWAEFLAAERLALAQRRPLRAAEAKARAAELEPLVPYMTVRVDARLPGLTITRNGEEVAEAAMGIALPVDPGSHVMTATAPGYETWTATVVISRPREHAVVDVPELRPLPPPPPAPTRPRKPEHASPTTHRPPPPPPAIAVKQRGLPLGVWATGGTSLVAAGLTGVFGSLSLASYSRADSLCPSHSHCTDDAMAARDRAELQANVANAALGTALVAATVGAVWYLTSGDSSDKTPGAEHASGY